MNRKRSVEYDPSTVPSKKKQSNHHTTAHEHKDRQPTTTIHNTDASSEKAHVQLTSLPHKNHIVPFAATSTTSKEMKITHNSSPSTHLKRGDHSCSLSTPASNPNKYDRTSPTPLPTRSHEQRIHSSKSLNLPNNIPELSSSKSACIDLTNEVKAKQSKTKSVTKQKDHSAKRGDTETNLPLTPTLTNAGLAEEMTQRNVSTHTVSQSQNHTNNRNHDASPLSYELVRVLTQLSDAQVVQHSFAIRIRKIEKKLDQVIDLQKKAPPDYSDKLQSLVTFMMKLYEAVSRLETNFSKIYNMHPHQRPP